MINDIKKIIQLSKYGFKAKTQMIFMVVFIIVGIVWEFVFQGMHWIGAFFIILAPAYFAQLLYGMGMSSMVGASPYKKRLQILYPVLANCILEFAAMTIIVLIKAFEMRLYPENRTGLMSVLLVTSLFCIALNIYSAVVYKYYALAIVLLLLPVMTMSFVFNVDSFYNFEGSLLADISDRVGFGGLVSFCYFSIVIGTAVQYFSSVAIYKKPLSEYAMGMAMRKALKG